VDGGKKFKRKETAVCAVARDESQNNRLGFWLAQWVSLSLEFNPNCLAEFSVGQLPT